MFDPPISLPSYLLFPNATAIHRGMTQMSASPAIYYWLSLLPVLVSLYQWRTPRADRPKGCRKLGLSKHQSNLHDEYDAKYSHGVSAHHIDEQGQPSWRIKALFTYPIKSCAGVELDVADVVPTGLAYDRQFCFAEYITPQPGADGSPAPPAYWTARTLRDGEFSKMALIRPEIWVPDPSAADYTPDLDEVKSHGVMLVHYPRVPTGTTRIHRFLTQVGITLRLLSKDLSFRVPLVPPSEQTYPCPPVKIWKDNPPAYDYGQHLPATLRQFLLDDSSSSSRRRGPLTLFRVNPNHHREIFRCAPRKETVGFQTVTGFADAYPLHLLNLASVRDVAARCADEIPYLSVRRFRANLIVQGPEAFAEDHWKRIRVGASSSSMRSTHRPETEKATRHDGAEIYTSCRTMRCKLPNVDPDTGIRHRSEPDRTLKSYRRIDVGDLTNAALGMQLVPVPREFALRVGDAVDVLERGEHCYIKMLAPGEIVEGV